MEAQTITTKPANTCSITRVSCCAIAALVLLRLCVGWHFLSEGAKKFTYDSGTGTWDIAAPIEPFFRGATGPLAGWFHRQVPGAYDWQTLLAVPQEMTPESDAQLRDWVSGYVTRRQRELQSGNPTEVEIPEFVPYATWSEEIVGDWRSLHKRFTDVKNLSDEQREQSADVFERHHRSLADYLAGESLDIQAYQHELWRLEQSQDDQEADEIPYEESRIDQKEAELSRTPRKWVAAVQAERDSLATDLKDLLTSDQHDSAVDAQVDSALTDPAERSLRWKSVAVSCLVFGVGVCLLAGLFTRVAAIAGALFMLSVMATQPPWVAGAQPIYYQLVEFASLLVLAATSAGRWLGLDFILHALWTKCCGAKATQS